MLPAEAHLERLASAGIAVSSHWSHTLYKPDDIIELNKGKPPASMGQFEKLQKEAGEPLAPAADPPKTLPSVPKDIDKKKYAVPTLKELGYNQEASTPYKVHPNPYVPRFFFHLALNPAGMPTREMLKLCSKCHPFNEGLARSRTCAALSSLCLLAGPCITQKQ